MERPKIQLTDDLLTPEMLKALPLHVQEKYRKAQELELEQKLEYELPHKFAYKHYKWSRKIYESRNKTILLCGANQIAKSSTQIRKFIEWATEKKLWAELWDHTPSQFWYLYPDKTVATVEFYEKWEREFLPRGEMKNDAKYGWVPEFENKKIVAIHFKSGVSIYFKTYMQDPASLQSGSVDAVACDEELPVHLYGEINSRRRATGGYFMMAFTATLGQALWYNAIEKMGEPVEALKEAEKYIIGLYDCQVYEDGSPSRWTNERIQQEIDTCLDQNEVKKRIYGRFVMDSNKAIKTFSREHNLVTPYRIPDDWYWYAGIDYGSGGEDNHPSAIVFIAVRPDFRKGAVVYGWKSPKQQINTMKTVVEKYSQLWLIVPDLEGKLVNQVSYDFSAKDMATYAVDIGLTFSPADKQREPSFRRLNSLFKARYLDIFNIECLQDLVAEIDTLTETAALVKRKQHAKDDMIDGMRYAESAIPWDHSGLQEAMASAKKDKDDPTPESKTEREINAERMKNERKNAQEAQYNVEEELTEFNGYLNDFNDFHALDLP